MYENSHGCQLRSYVIFMALRQQAGFSSPPLEEQEARPERPGAMEPPYRVFERLYHQ